MVERKKLVPDHFSEKSIVDCLSKAVIFSGVYQSALSRLAQQGHQRFYAPNNDLWIENQDIPLVGFILSGEVLEEKRRTNGRFIIFDSLKDGDIFGEERFIHQNLKSRHTLRALTKTTTLAFNDPVDILDALGEMYPVFLKNLALEFVRRNGQRDVLAMETLMMLVPTRFALYLLKAASKCPIMIEKSSVLIPRETQPVVAARLATSRESVTKVSLIFEQFGLIHRQKGAISIDDVRALRDIALKGRNLTFSALQASTEGQFQGARVQK
ncbi:MAG: Crp/Fnr family transcriptional regulator [bacterium]|nr:Crp/Fnr family transcriptional regulator [bacterium]